LVGGGLVGGGLVGGGVVGFGAVTGARCAVVAVDLPRVVVVLRPKVVAGPDVVDASLEVGVSGFVVVVDDVGWTWTTISLGLPAELGTPAMATPSPMHTRRRRTMPARRAAGPCQSMAGEANNREFFCGGSISGPTTCLGSRPDSNGPVRPYKCGYMGAACRSNTVPTLRDEGQKRWSGV
jgi:hypothetical protein